MHIEYFIKWIAILAYLYREYMSYTNVIHFFFSLLSVNITFSLLSRTYIQEYRQERNYIVDYIKLSIFTLGVLCRRARSTKSISFLNLFKKKETKASTFFNGNQKYKTIKNKNKNIYMHANTCINRYMHACMNAYIYTCICLEKCKHI